MGHFEAIKYAVDWCQGQTKQTSESHRSVCEFVNLFPTKSSQYTGFYYAMQEVLITSEPVKDQQQQLEEQIVVEPTRA